jgi:hypothetical protein
VIEADLRRRSELQLAGSQWPRAEVEFVVVHASAWGVVKVISVRNLPLVSVRLSYQLAARTSRQRQIISASCPRLVVVIATLAVLRATVVQTPIATPIVAALARDPVTAHLG